MSARPDEPVRLTWTDRDETARAGGHAEDGHAILPRRDAEQLLHWLLRDGDDRFDFSIDTWPAAMSAAASTPTPEAPVGWLALLGFLSSVWGFLVKHRAVLAAAGVLLGFLVLAGLSIYLPTAHMRTIPVAALAIFALLVGFLVNVLPKPTP